MADHHPRQLNHLHFKARPESLNYKGSGRGSFAKFVRANRNAHVILLQGQLSSIKNKFENIKSDREATNISTDFGLILNVTSEPGYPLKYESLESNPRGSTPAISLLNLRHEETSEGLVSKAAIFVPHGQLKVLEKKVEQYADPTKDNRDKEGQIRGPRNAELLNNIHSIGVAALDALWTDPDTLPAEHEISWFELWIRRDGPDWHQKLLHECSRLEIEVPDQTLTFPDHIVVIAHASRQQLESSLDLLNCLSEVRKARPCSVGLTDLTGVEQEEWMNEALERITWPAGDAPAVCVLDSGIQRAHPLLEPLLKIEDMFSVFEDGDTADDLTHGTSMGGLAAYGDLRNIMLSSATWEQFHRLESVKLVRSSSAHDPENYGAVTLQAISEPEISSPHRHRVFCMAITTPGPNTLGNPSSWSTALDIAASGAQAEDDLPRVIIVSAGNTETEINDGSLNYPKTILENPIEDPAQAWNVITVGAVTNRTTIEESDDEALRSNSVAPDHGLSPYSRTSHNWRTDWPISPDVVMEGGNLGRDQQGDLLHFPSLEPLSTATNYSIRPFAPFNATSAATALASRVAIRILQKYPDLRPETLRGLLVHSARWPQEVLEREGLDPFSAGSTEGVKKLMRSYGYGVVDETRALNSLKNQTTFFIEDTIQPYTGEAGKAKLNECHVIDLPWPKELLEANDDVTFTLKITLSYFIQPNSGSRCWDNGTKYKYASHLLGFTPKHAGHSLKEFKSRLNADEDNLAESLPDPGWALGSKARGKCGSLVQDIWKGSAADLASMEAISVFPRAKGWWATRKYDNNREEHNCHLRKVPYSLIISIETEADLPIYTAVSSAITQIESSASVSIGT